MRVLVTGASSGLGAELGRQLAARGDRVALLARRRERLEEVADAAVAAARAAGVADPFRPLVLAVDVLETQAFCEAIGTASEQLGGEGLDCAILNAGIHGQQPGESFSAAAAARAIDVNLTANIHAIGALLPPMLARGRGHLVGVSSIAGYRGLPGGAPYSASKAGFTTLLEGLRIDLKPHGIAVTVVSPGFVRSELTDKNHFPMPFLLETDDAVRRMLRGIDRRRREVRFPWPLVLAARLLRALPDPLYDLVGARLSRVRRRREGRAGAGG